MAALKKRSLHFSYAWLKKLPKPEALDELGLGSGNRVLVRGGRLDTKYRITVPEDMWTQAAPTDKPGSLTHVLPVVAAETCFALKGGTATNLFIRDLPRLSVDIDLVYLPKDDHDEALTRIADAFSRIADAISKAMPETGLRSPVVRSSSSVVYSIAPWLGSVDWAGCPHGKRLIRTRSPLILRTVCLVSPDSLAMADSPVPLSNSRAT